MATKQFDIAKEDAEHEITVSNGLASADNDNLGTDHVRVVADTTLTSGELWTLLQRVAARAEKERALFTPAV